MFPNREMNWVAIVLKGSRWRSEFGQPVPFPHALILDWIFPNWQINVRGAFLICPEEIDFFWTAKLCLFLNYQLFLTANKYFKYFKYFKMYSMFSKSHSPLHCNTSRKRNLFWQLDPFRISHGCRRGQQLTSKRKSSEKSMWCCQHHSRW